MKTVAMAAILLTGCSAGVMRPWSQAQQVDESSCLATCEKHDQECPKIFAAFPERGAVECPASHADCVESCKATSVAVTPSPPTTPSPPRTSQPAATQPPTNTSKEAKLRELKRLYEQGLVTDEVYKERQLAILSEP
jgi:hypothetical protein